MSEASDIARHQHMCLHLIHFCQIIANIDICIVQVFVAVFQSIVQSLPADNCLDFQVVCQ